MDDMEKLLEAVSVESEARLRYHSSDPYQSHLSSQYRIFHHYMFPPQQTWGSGDQWPSDRLERPGKIHVSLNAIRSFVTSEARLESLHPRITIPATMLPDAERRRAEAAEQTMLTWLEMSGWDVWLFDLCLVKGTYGKVALKPYWNAEEKRGDVHLIELPWNLRVGWGSSDYRSKDWAIYEYRLSAYEAKRRFRNLEIVKGEKKGQLDVRRVGDHTDPLGQKPIENPSLVQDPLPFRPPHDYELQHVAVWDYWYKQNGKIVNAILINGVLIEGPHPHPEYRDIPYIVIEHDHEPGSPEGVSGVVDLIDSQLELNRLISHAYQFVADNIDPAWFVYGPDAANLTEGIVPKAGEAVSTGESRIEEVPKGSGTLAFTDLIRETWNTMHRISGLPEIGLGGLASSDISGRAIAVQIQSFANRLDPRRARLYRGLQELLNAWVYMGVQKNPSLGAGVDEEGNPLTSSLGEMLEGFNRWKIIAPEITPKDFLDATTNETNKLNARVQSARTTMDNLGIENPEAELDLIREERVDGQLFPESAQAYLALHTMLLQIQQQQQAMVQQQAGMQEQLSAMSGGMSADAQAQQALAVSQQQQYEAQPTLRPDQNASLPATQAGSPPPGNGQGPAATTLIRGGQALNQLAFSSGGSQ